MYNMFIFQVLTKTDLMLNTFYDLTLKLFRLYSCFATGADSDAVLPI